MRRLLLVVLLALAACGDDADPAVSAGDGGGGEPAGEPTITGEITASTPFEAVTEGCVDGSDLPPDAAVSSDDPPICTPADNDVLGSIVVASADGDQGSLTITTATDMEEGRTFDDLTVGTEVSVWVSGPIAESFPWQARADAVRIEP